MKFYITLAFQLFFFQECHSFSPPHKKLTPRTQITSRTSLTSHTQLTFLKTREIYARTKGDSYLSTLYLDHSESVQLPVKYRITSTDVFPPFSYFDSHIDDALDDLDRPKIAPLIKAADGKCWTCTAKKVVSEYFCIYTFAGYLFSTAQLPTPKSMHMTRYQLQILAKDNSSRTGTTRVYINHVSPCFPMSELYSNLQANCTNVLTNVTSFSDDSVYTLPANFTITNVRFVTFSHANGEYELSVMLNSKRFQQRFEYRSSPKHFKERNSVLPRIYPNYFSIFMQKYIKTLSEKTTVKFQLKSIDKDILIKNISVELYGYFERANQNSQCMRTYALWEKGYLRLMKSGRNMICARDNKMVYPQYRSRDAKLKLSIETKTTLFKQKVYLTCTLRKAEPVSNVIWLRDGKQISGKGNHLTISIYDFFDTSVFYCTALLYGIEIKSNKMKIRFTDLVTSYFDIITPEEKFKMALGRYGNKLENVISDKIKLHVRNSIDDVIEMKSRYKVTMKSGLVVQTIILATHINSSNLYKPLFYERLGDLKSLFTPHLYESYIISVADKDYCLPETTGLLSSYGVYKWNATQVGHAQKLHCNHGNKTTERVCRGVTHDVRAKWRDPNLLKCEYTDDKTKDLTKVLQTLPTKTASESSEQMKNLTENSTLLTVEDVILTADILKGLADGNKSIDIKTWTNVMLTASQLMQSNTTVLSAVRSTTNKVNSIIDSIEEISSELNQSVDFIKFSTHNLAAIVLQQKSQNFTGLTLNFNTNHNGSQPHFDVLDNDESMSFKFPETIFSDLQTNKTNINAMYFTDTSFYAMTSYLNGQRKRLTSGVLSLTLGDKRHLNLSKDIQWKLRVDAIAHASAYKCVFWKVQGNHGDWSTIGCRVNSVVDHLVTCSCNHLTSFAVLFDPSLLGGNEPTISSSNQLALSLITYIGCTISIVCVVFTMATILLFRSLRENKPSQVVLGLCFSLGMLMITFVALVDRTRPKLLCNITSAAVQYFLLSLFCWMFFEGITLYLKVVKVMGEYGSCFILKASLFSFGIPGVIVAVFMSINIDDYGTSERCIVTGNAFRYGTFTPIAFFLLFNFVIFIKVVASLCSRHSITKLGNTIDIQKQVRISLSCSFLLGLTWVFGVMAISDARIIFQYLFTITNSLQGLFICYFNALRQERVREAWKNLLLRGKIEFDLSVSSSTFRTKATSSPSVNKASSYSKSIYTHSFDKTIDWGVRSDSLNRSSDSLDIDHLSYNSEIAFSSFVERPYTGSISSSRS